MTVAVPLVSALDEASLRPPTAAGGSLLDAITAAPGCLVYFLLNVGDGDAQVLLLPPDSNDKVRRLVLVDVAIKKKVPALLRELARAGLIEAPGSAGQIRLVVATHPHFDHIGGMGEIVSLYGQYQVSGTGIQEFWDPGYYFAQPAFHALMRSLESAPWIHRLEPTSGTTRFLDTVRLTVLGPGIGLTTRFDTYGVGVNDASITLMVEFPASRIYAQSDPGQGRKNRRPVPNRGRRILLGADAQFTSWAQTTIDFPALAQAQNSPLARELRAARGADYLSADVFKLSHHGSKHGSNLEILERIAPSLSLVSSVAGGGKYNFPHLLGIEAAREARQPSTSARVVRDSDQILGIHVTGAHLSDGHPAGSLALVVPVTGGTPMRLFRLMDSPKAAPRLASAREVIL